MRPYRPYASVADRRRSSPFADWYAADAYLPAHDGMSGADRRYLCDVAELTEAVDGSGHDDKVVDGVSPVIASHCTDATHRDAGVQS